MAIGEIHPGRTTDGWRIRRSTSTDVPSIASLFDEYRQTFGYSSERNAALTYIRECVAGGEVVVFTAGDASRPLDLLGFAVLYPAFSSLSMHRTWHLQDLYVVPKARRRGIARSLIEHTVKFAKLNSSEHITLLFPTGNPALSNLFISFGFEPYPYEQDQLRYRLKFS